jgi:hypothetical protein
MSVPKQYLPVLIVIVSLGLLLNFTQRSRQTDWTDPQSLEEVQAIAKKLGLHCRSDRADGGIGFRLLVSEAPLSLERANLLRFGGREESAKGRANWLRVVAVYQTWNFETDLVMPWGKLFLYGDPPLIEKLTGQKIGQG